MQEPAYLHVPETKCETSPDTYFSEVTHHTPPPLARPEPAQQTTCATCILVARSSKSAGETVTKVVWKKGRTGAERLRRTRSKRIKHHGVSGTHSTYNLYVAECTRRASTGRAIAQIPAHKIRLPAHSPVARKALPRSARATNVSPKHTHRCHEQGAITPMDLDGGSYPAKKH